MWVGMAVAFLTVMVPGCVIIPLGDLFQEQPLQEQVIDDQDGSSKRKIALIDIDGAITGRATGGFLSSVPNTVAEIKMRLQRAASDSNVKAVVLRISSPGGEVTACDLIYSEVMQLRENNDLPVVACIMDQGASGGYYIACAANKIYAHPTSIVGSIGVILQSFDVSELLEKVGIAVSPVKSAEKKDINSIFRPQTEEERQLLQQLVDDMYGRFVDIVDKSRESLNREQVLALADGRVVSGVQAAESKLVDSIGYLQDAIDEAASLADIEDPRVIRYTRMAHSGSNIYTQLGSPQPAAGAEIRLQWSPDAYPRSGLYYLWTP